MDTFENRMDWPEGFLWTCCDRMGFRRSCTRVRHDAKSTQRGRYGREVGNLRYLEGDWRGLNSKAEEYESEDDRVEDVDEDYQDHSECKCKEKSEHEETSEGKDKSEDKAEEKAEESENDKE